MIRFMRHEKCFTNIMNNTIEVYYPKGFMSLFDIDDVGLVLGKRSYICKPKNTSPYVLLFSRKSFHRTILNPPRNKDVDHINRNTLDNRRKNLRVVHQSINQLNRGKTKSKTSSKYKGVFFRPKRNKWFSETTLYGKTYFIGTYLSEIDAARAYNNFFISRNINILLNEIS